MINQETTQTISTPTGHCISLPHKVQRKPIVNDTGLPFQRDSECTLGTVATRARASHGKNTLLEEMKYYALIRAASSYPLAILAVSHMSE